MQARVRERREEMAEMRAETESHLACRSEVWKDAEEDEAEKHRKKRAEAMTKKISGGRGRREVESERRRERERRRKQRRRAEEWREVKRWTGVLPLRRGSESKEMNAWWAEAIRRERMMR